MQQFLDLLRDIRDNGVRKINRTGTDTIGVIGRQLRFDLRKGFPLVTTRPIYVRALIYENLFFIRGGTNNMDLIDNDVHIWDKWMVPEDITDEVRLSDPDRAVALSNKLGIKTNEAIQQLDHLGYGKAIEFLDENAIPTHRTVVKVKKGELGPIYGYQWRFWKASNGQRIDQLAEAIQMLRTNPYSRRIIVSAWNPEDLPDEKKSPQQNAAEGKQCLAACHTFFQLSVTPHREPEEKTTKGVLHLHLYQRSLDSPVGGPYNIASYSMLLAMIAQVTDLEAGEFIWTINDAHIYISQLALVDEQLQREPQPLSTLWLNPEVKELWDFTYDDIKILDYNPVKPQLKYPVHV